MAFITDNLDEFTVALSSDASVPSGGGACALAGAVGVSLAEMVGNLTVGKEAYKDVSATVTDLLNEAEQVRVELLQLVDADAEAFEPLAKAYGIPKDDITREDTIQTALREACAPPMQTMRAVAHGIEIHEKMAKIGNKMAISDIGVGVTLCKAALKGASLNVFINTQALTDRIMADKLNEEVTLLLEKYEALADQVYAGVNDALKG